MNYHTFYFWMYSSKLQYESQYTNDKTTVLIDIGYP